MSQPPKLAAQIGLLGVSLILSIAVAEYAFRSISSERGQLAGMYVAVDHAGLGLRPGFQGFHKTSEFEYGFTINQLGMRDRPVAAKPPGTTRILVIGDSFVFGVGVELDDSLAKAMQRRLNSESAIGEFEVLNAGVPAYSTFQELWALRRLDPLLEPDLVLWVFFVGDDWYGNQQRPPPEEARQGAIEQLRIRSALYRAFDRFVLGRLKAGRTYEMHAREPSPAFHERSTRVLDLLQQAREVTNAPLLIALNPRYSQVYPETWSKVALLYRLSDEDYDPSEPNTGFAYRLRAAGFWVVDLLPALREAGGERTLHFPIDGHWNEDGTRLVADVLSDSILARIGERLHP